MSLRRNLRVVARFQARQGRFKAPRGGFPTPAIEATAKKWTAEAETSHVLGDWRARSKSSPEYGWVSRCTRCDMSFLLEYNDLQGRDNTTHALLVDRGAGVNFRVESPVLDKEEWESSVCSPEAIDLIRGINVAVEDKGALLAQPSGKVAEALLKVIMARGLGDHWTDPDNRKVSESFALKGGRAAGVPVLLHAQFWREDQRRNYKPKGGFLLPEFEFEKELTFSNHEVLRLQAIEWHDGQKWARQPLHDLKAKT